MISQLNDVYNRIHRKGLESFQKKAYYIDPYLSNSELDERYALSSLIQLRRNDHIDSLLRQLLADFPDQYVYPEEDLHITVITLISAREGLVLHPADVARYLDALGEAVSGFPAFAVSFRGLILSETGILLKGFYTSTLLDLRNAIRRKIQERDLLLEERYETISSHVTLLRLKTESESISEIPGFVHTRYEENYGETEVNSITLLRGDWYNHRKQLLKRFELHNR